MAQLAARRSHNPKVASSILAGSIHIYIFFLRAGILFCVAEVLNVGIAFGWMAERSKALV